MSHEYPVSILCKVFAVSRSGFYTWRGIEASEEEIIQNLQIKTEINIAFVDSNQTYGHRLIRDVLSDKGIFISFRCVLESMMAQGLVALPHVKKKSPYAKSAPEETIIQ